MADLIPGLLPHYHLQVLPFNLIDILDQPGQRLHHTFRQQNTYHKDNNQTEHNCSHNQKRNADCRGRHSVERTVQINVPVISRNLPLFQHIVLQTLCPAGQLLQGKPAGSPPVPRHGKGIGRRCSSVGNHNPVVVLKKP